MLISRPDLLVSRIDHLQVTGSFADSDLLGTFRDYLEQLLSLLPMGDSLHFPRRAFRSGRAYDSAFSSIRGGLRGGYSIFQDDHRLDFLIILPGRYCRQLESYRSVCQLLAGHKLTRVDVAIDDHRRRVSASRVCAAGYSHHYRWVDSFKLVSSSLSRGAPPTPTAYFGKKNKVLRFYDAEVVHGIHADRWELQLRNDYARSFLEHYLGPDGDPSLSSYVLGGVDFGIGDRYDSFKRFSWWQSLIDDCGQTILDLPEYIPTFERSLAWLFSQVAPTLAIAHDGYGPENFQTLINALVASGRKRFTDYHHKTIQELKKEEFCLNG